MCNFSPIVVVVVRLLLMITVVAVTTECSVETPSVDFSSEDSFPSSDSLNSRSSNSVEIEGLASDQPPPPSPSIDDPDMTQLEPQNVIMTSSSSRIVVAIATSGLFPGVHGGVDDDDVAVTSSSSSDLLEQVVDVRGPGRGEEGDDDTDAFAPKEVVVIAICVTLLSLVIVVFSVVMTFLIRRRMRRKAYLRVKHASQTELAVHYVQNTPASVAARDAAMEQLFQSLASIDPDGQTKDCTQLNYENEERCMSPTESIASADLIDGKSKAYSRSMPSLKNLNAHEEALNATFANILQENSGKLKGRSRSFTERAALRVDVDRSKTAARSHSEKVKNRLLVSTAGKRFEKKTNNKTNRRTAPSFSRLARFNLLRNLSTKRKPAVPAETEAHLPCISKTATEAVASDSKRHSDSLLDFKMPTMSPILQDMVPMLTALQSNNEPRTDQMSEHSSEAAPRQRNRLGSSETSLQSAVESNKRQYINRHSASHTSLQSGIQNGSIRNHSSNLAICADAEPENLAPNRQKAETSEGIRGGYLPGSGKRVPDIATEVSAGNKFSSVGHLETSCKDRSPIKHNKQTIS